MARHGSGCARSAISAERGSAGRIPSRCGTKLGEDNVQGIHRVAFVRGSSNRSTAQRLLVSVSRFMARAANNFLHQRECESATDRFVHHERLLRGLQSFLKDGRLRFWSGRLLHLGTRTSAHTRGEVREKREGRSKTSRCFDRFDFTRKIKARRSVRLASAERTLERHLQI
jgi:hypothetical protein